MIIERKNGRKCTCGNRGCVQTYCSIKALKERVMQRKEKNEITGKELLEIIKNDFDSVSDIVDEYLEDLTIAISNYINIFEPEGIVLGGSFVHYGDILLDKLVKKVKENDMIFNKVVPDIILAKNGNDAGIIGATLIF